MKARVAEVQGDGGQSDSEWERDTEREWKELKDMKDLRNGTERHERFEKWRGSWTERRKIEK